MTARERVRAFFDRRIPDRVPINYIGNPGIDLRLKEHFGLAANDEEGLRQALEVDFRSVEAPYVGPPLHAPQPGLEVDPVWGFRQIRVEHESGAYHEICEWPLTNADEEALRRWPLPSPDDFDYSVVTSNAARWRDYGVSAGRPVTATRSTSPAACARWSRSCLTSRPTTNPRWIS